MADALAIATSLVHLHAQQATGKRLQQQCAAGWQALAGGGDGVFVYRLMGMMRPPVSVFVGGHAWTHAQLSIISRWSSGGAVSGGAESVLRLVKPSAGRCAVQRVEHPLAQTLVELSALG